MTRIENFMRHIDKTMYENKQDKTLVLKLGDQELSIDLLYYTSEQLNVFLCKYIDFMNERES